MEPFLQRAAASREMLVPVYSAMLRLASTQTSFVRRESYFDQLGKLCSAPRKLLSTGLRVFCELGFFSMQESGAFRITARREAPKRELSQSRTFAAVNGALEAYQTLGKLQK